MEIKAGIVDDERKARELLIHLLRKNCPQVEVVFDADSLNAAKTAIQHHAPDLIFLDIQMADASGFDLFKEVDEINFETIFITAYSEYALDAFSVNASGYLVKPVVPEALIRTVETAGKRIEAKKEQERSRAKDKLLAIIGHDIKTPINSLKSLVQLMLDGHISRNEFYEACGHVGNNIDNLHLTLNNLLNWATSQMKQTVTEFSAVDIFEVTQDVINFLNEVARQKRITVDNDITTNTLAWCDKNQIELVVRNLLSNAIKFSSPDSVVKITIENHSPGGMTISIVDNGIGMTPESANAIFLSDSKIQPTFGTSNERGTGLGLALCNEFVKNNGGKIGVKTQFGEGSTFYFTLNKVQSKEK